MLLVDHFERTARENPGQTFVHFVQDDAQSDVKLTYAEAQERAAHFAALLKGLGVRRGEPVALLVPNSAEWLVYYFGCQKIGAVASGLNTDLRVGELKGFLETINPRVLVTTAALNALAQELRTVSPGIRHILSDAPAGDMLDASARSPEPMLARDPTLDDDALLSIVFTSGTTGARPKAALQRSSSIINGIAGYQEHVRLTADDRIMLVTPLFHGSALNWGTTMAVLAGAPIVLAARFSASRFWGQADRGGATVLWTMGAIAVILLGMPVSDVEKRASARLRILFANGAGGRWRQVKERWDCGVLDGYGSTETPGTLASADCYDLPDPYPCLGRPVKGVALRIVDPETGADVAVREVGEIVSRFGQGFAGYFNNEAALEEAVRDGWFHTGDLAYHDEENRYFFVDRLKSIIRRGGENISSFEIENLVVQHPEVHEAIALPKAHDVLGETVFLGLVPLQPGRSFTLEEIHDFVRDHLAPFKWPEEVRTLDPATIPRTESGKVKKLLLRQALGLTR
ncbi:class I adenylate-forming enzyme family protein [Bosea sp. (in: a-proteobacteria)]|uniref:class I adenylate-forming enzyme family protein n=1 Tax=Bosea sp. (in: a-proteobacteria) TaxID=1871050 RepID=UPI002608D944|nr:class I adenylate-forming enzyme family protein [Bosea sp. (in: a-proteobacteria)]MCO5090916.1 acyl--CoA ligase [Bosea sp. (in: a-proteobacteria)]